jgi:hypothetical protein
MNGFDVYKLYLALKFHFTQDSYDFFKYGGKTKAKVSTYENRKDKYFFEKLGKTHDNQTIFNYLLANLVNNNKIWIGEMFDGKCDIIYTNWQKRQQSLSYVFEQDCEKIMAYTENNRTTFNKIFQCEKHQHPDIFKLLLQEEITIEGFIILDSLIGFFKDLDKNLPDDVMWKDVGKRCKNYKPFMPACNNTPKYRKIIRDKMKKYELIA